MSNTENQNSAVDADPDSQHSKNTAQSNPEQAKQEQSDNLTQPEVEVTDARDGDVNGQGDSQAEQSENSDELAVAREEIAKLKDAFMRAKAEEENVRRRTEKEVANSRKFAVEGFAKEMLNVRDSLKLASDVEIADDADETIKSIHQGVEITLKQLDSVFAKFSLVEISPNAGDKLDPNLHQAMSMVESDEQESGKIISVIQAGFQLHDRLLRPAMVIVAK